MCISCWVDITLTRNSSGPVSISSRRSSVVATNLVLANTGADAFSYREQGFQVVGKRVITNLDVRKIVISTRPVFKSHVNSIYAHPSPRSSNSTNHIAFRILRLVQTPTGRSSHSQNRQNLPRQCRSERKSFVSSELTCKLDQRMLIFGGSTLASFGD